MSCQARHTPRFQTAEGSGCSARTAPFVSVSRGRDHSSAGWWDCAEPKPQAQPTQGRQPDLLCSPFCTQEARPGVSSAGGEQGSGLDPAERELAGLPHGWMRLERNRNGNVHHNSVQSHSSRPGHLPSAEPGEAAGSRPRGRSRCSACTEHRGGRQQGRGRQPQQENGKDMGQDPETFLCSALSLGTPGGGPVSWVRVD